MHKIDPRAVVTLFRQLADIHAKSIAEDRSEVVSLIETDPMWGESFRSRYDPYVPGLGWGVNLEACPIRYTGIDLFHALGNLSRKVLLRLLDCGLEEHDVESFSIAIARFEETLSNPK